MRLIDADTFECFTGDVPDHFDAKSYMAGAEHVLNRIDDATTVDAVQVTRCTRCKWYDHELYVCAKLSATTNPNDFCSMYGEERYPNIKI